jgi:hypothetical protein
MLHYFYFEVFDSQPFFLAKTSYGWFANQIIYIYKYIYTQSFFPKKNYYKKIGKFLEISF